MSLVDSAAVTIPSIAIPESKKNKEWHEQFTKAIMNQSLTDSYDLSYKAMDECYKFYQGIQGGDQFKYLQEADDGEVLPAEWINYNKIQVKIDLLLGELIERGYEIQVKALNKEVKTKKLEEKARMLVEMRMRPFEKELEEELGMSISSNEYVPEDEDELEDHFNYTWKDHSEIVMESALKFLAKRNNWDYERIALARDMYIAGRVFAKSEIINGLPTIRRVDPRYMIFDPHAKDDMLSDSTYFGEVRYMNMAELMERYGLSQSEIEKAKGTFEKLNKQKLSTPNSMGAINGLDIVGNLQFYRSDNSELRVLVVTACWADYKTLKHKKSVDKYGNEHYPQVGENTKGDDVLSNKVKIWRKGTLVGGMIFKDWGEVKNQGRDVETLSEALPPYFGLIPNYINNRSISKVEQLKGLQKLKDITMYSLQLAMTRAGAKGFFYDLAQLPEGWDIATTMKYLKVAGIAFIDSQKDGQPANFNQFREIDLTLSSSVEQYIGISAMVDREMDAISGINEARQGIVKNASQAVGVTQSALMQSNLSTASLKKFFNMFTSKLLNHQAQLVKIAWAGKDKFAYIIGDEGVDFLEEDDLPLNDYGVFVEEIPPAINDVQNFHAIVQAALQAGAIDFVSAIKLLQETDTKLGIRRLERDAAKKAKEQQQQQSQMMAQEAQQAQQMQQSQMEGELMKLAAETDAKTSGKIQEILTKGKIDLGLKSLDLRKGVADAFDTRLRR